MTAQPPLLVPYVAGAVRLTGAVIAIGWSDVGMMQTSANLMIEGNPEDLTTSSADNVCCRRIDDPSVSAVPVNLPALSVNAQAAPVDAATWSRLAAFAQRTFAPATEASRLSGAETGLIDNN